MQESQRESQREEGTALKTECKRIKTVKDYVPILPFQQQKVHLWGSVYSVAVCRMTAVVKISEKVRKQRNWTSVDFYTILRI